MKRLISVVKKPIRCKYSGGVRNWAFAAGLILATLGSGELAAISPNVDVHDSSYFASIDSLSKESGWLPLRQEAVPTGSFEARIWIGFGGTRLRGVLIKRDGNTWSGQYVRAGLNAYPFEKRSVEPKDGWETLWRKINDLGFLSLPDASTLPNEAIRVFDGTSYVIEINDGGTYRAYKYENPKSHKWPEAKQIVEIVDILQNDLDLGK